MQTEIELILNTGGQLAAIVIPKALEAPQLNATMALAPNFFCDVKLAQAWGAWSVFRSDYATFPKGRPAGFKLHFLPL